MSGIDKEDLYGSEEEIEEHLEDIRSKLDLLKQCNADEVEEVKAKIDKILKLVNDALNTYECNIQLLDFQEKKEFNAKHSTYRATVEDLKNQLKAETESPEIEQEKLEQYVEITNMDNKNVVKQAQKIGNAIQDDSLQTAKNILGRIKDSEKIVKDINKEIEEQNRKLLASEEDIKDAMSSLKRAGELVDFFDKAFKKDIFLKIMLGLIGLCIIGVIVFMCISKGVSSSTASAAAKTVIDTGVDPVNCDTANLSASTAASTNNGKINCVEFANSLDKTANDSLKPGMEEPTVPTAGGRLLLSLGS